MKAMIFAAGLGTRLHPYTHEKPKALVEIAGKPLLQWNIERLKKAGFNQLIINVHHYAQQVIDFINQYPDPAIELVISNEADQLLDTGGGLKKASWFLKGEEPFLLHNVDVLTTMDYQRLMNFHTSGDALATLAVRQRQTSRYLLFNEERLLCGWCNTRSGEEIITRYSEEHSALAFSGIQVINPEIFDLIEEEDRFSLISLYLRLSENQKILAYLHDTDQWLDVGKPKQLKMAEELFHESGL